MNKLYYLKAACHYCGESMEIIVTWQEKLELIAGGHDNADFTSLSEDQSKKAIHTPYNVYIGEAYHPHCLLKEGYELKH